MKKKPSSAKLRRASDPNVFLFISMKEEAEEEVEEDGPAKGQPQLSLDAERVRF
jgi:hypothetical protein